jgi:hypothetical protein
MEGKVMKSKIDSLNNLKLLKIEADKFLKIMDEFAELETLAKPMLKESYMNLLNERNNFNQEVIKFKRVNNKGKMKK